MSQPASPAAEELRSTGVFRRLAALIYDGFLLFGLLVVPLFIVTAMQRNRAPAQPDGVVHELPLIAPHAVMQLYALTVIISFYCYFWRKNGQTLGMQAWRIRLDSAAGGRPSLRQCLIRIAVGLVSLTLGGLGYWWIWLDRQQRAWHDRASHTRVVLLPKRKT